MNEREDDRDRCGRKGEELAGEPSFARGEVWTDQRRSQVERRFAAVDVREEGKREGVLTEVGQPSFWVAAPRTSDGR